MESEAVGKNAGENNRKKRLQRTANPESTRREKPAAILLLLICVGLVAANVFIYEQVRNFDFIRVDDPLISESPNIAGGLTWANVAWVFANFHGGFWIPLTWLSHMAEIQLFGLNAGFQHMTNVLLHTIDTVLLLILLVKLTGALWRSAFVATLFAVHPLHVESVAWITERKDVLSASFWILIIFAYVAYIHKPRWTRHSGLLVLYALGLMVKPMLVTMPFVLLLLDIWPLNRVPFHATESQSLVSQKVPWLKWIREKVPLFVLALACSIVTFIAQKQIGAVAETEIQPLGMRIANACTSYVFYLFKMVWPVRLAMLYRYPDSIPAWEVLGAIVALTAVSALVIWKRHEKPYLFVGWFLYLGMLVPVIGLVQAGVQAHADRFTYLPLIGVFIVISWGVADLLRTWPVLKRVVPAILVLASVALAVVSRNQASYWRDNVTIWTQMMKANLGIEDYRAHLALAGLLKNRGRDSEVLKHLNAAIRLKPDSAEAKDELGQVLMTQGKIADATAAFQAAMRLKPDFGRAHIDLAFALLAQGRRAEAEQRFREALHWLPDSAETHVAFGTLLMEDGKFDEALAHLAEGVRLRPDLPEAHRKLGQLLIAQGKNQDAIACLNNALQIKPDSAEIHNDLGQALEDEGRTDEAIRHFSEALRLNPNFAEADNNWGTILARKGKLKEALTHFAAAVTLDPDYSNAHINLGLTFARLGMTAEATREFTEVLRLEPGNDGVRRALEELKKKERK
jgi:protein O-mannosyl-transferase